MNYKFMLIVILCNRLILIVSRTACPSTNETMANEGAANMAFEQITCANRPGIGQAHVAAAATNGKGCWKCSKCGPQFSALSHRVSAYCTVTPNPQHPFSPSSS